jgi:hypothetical protein
MYLKIRCDKKSTVFLRNILELNEARTYDMAWGPFAHWTEDTHNRQGMGQGLAPLSATVRIPPD